MNKKFVINKTLATLLFKNGYITIPRGGFAAVGVEDVGTFEFISAHERGWIEVADKAPTSVGVPAIETVAIENPNKGMTVDELKAELGKESPKDEKVIIEALGHGAPAGADSEAGAKAEALGQDSTVEVNPAAEAEAAKPAAKPAAKKAK